jgi:hypothetical protein
MGHHGDQRTIIPVTVQLLGQDGQVFLSSSATQYESNVADSPVFSPGTWPSSSTPTELPDAIQRVEFNQTGQGGLAYRARARADAFARDPDTFRRLLLPAQW